mgnify:CR=1 FL=1
MLQQALTLYVERMPKYYFDKKIIPDTLVGGNHEKPADDFYKKLFEKFVDSDKLVQKYWNVRYDIEFLTRDINIHEELSEELRDYEEFKIFIPGFIGTHVSPNVGSGNLSGY